MSKTQWFMSKTQWFMSKTQWFMDEVQDQCRFKCRIRAGT